MAKNSSAPGTKLITHNRKARHNYEIEETVEAGVALAGTEVKACRAGKANLNEAYAVVREGEAWLLQAHINPYEFGNRENHDPIRPRKLLLHRPEIDRLHAKVAQEGRAIVPLRMYFKHGLVKVELGIGRGKKTYDKRRSIAERSEERRMRRELGRRR